MALINCDIYNLRNEHLKAMMRGYSAGLSKAEGHLRWLCSHNAKRSGHFILKSVFTYVLKTSSPYTTILSYLRSATDPLL